MAGARDQYINNLDALFPQQQQDLYAALMQAGMSPPDLSIGSQGAQELLALSPDKYDAQNYLKWANDQQGTQMDNLKFVLSLLNASQGSQIDTAKLGIAQSAEQRAQQEFEANRPIDWSGPAGQTLGGLLNQDNLTAYMAGDAAAGVALLHEIATNVGEVDANGDPKPGEMSWRAFQAVNDQMDATAPMSNADQNAQAQDSLNQGIIDQFGGRLSYQLSGTPELGQAVRDLVGQAQDPNKVLAFLSANSSNPAQAQAAMRLAQNPNYDKLFGLPAPIGSGVTPSGIDFSRPVQTKDQQMKAEQQKAWNEGPALNRANNPAAQATQTWNQPGVTNPNMTPAQAFELLHSPEAMLAASRPQPAPPAASPGTSRSLFTAITAPVKAAQAKAQATSTKPKPKPQTNTKSKNKAT